MRFTGWSEVWFHAEVELETTGPEPGAATCGENRRFLDFGHVEYVDKELSRPDPGHDVFVCGGAIGVDRLGT